MTNLHPDALARKLASPIAPAVVSDLTCEAALGVPWRTLRSWCREHHVPIGRIGRRPVVRVADVLAALEPRADAWSADAVVVAIGGRR